MPTTPAFDVNETLLDLGALDPLFEAVLGDPGLRPQLVVSSMRRDGCRLIRRCRTR